jgi:hypothetical protein
MSINPEEGYEVGYKKPPKATRFQKGKSANPNGRPRKVDEPFDPGAVLQAIENEQITVPEKGKRKRMTKAEAHFRELFDAAIDGDLKMARDVVSMAEGYFAAEASADRDYILIGVSEAKQRFGKNWRQKVDDYTNVPDESEQ